jgi:hypothetical protein
VKPKTSFRHLVQLGNVDDTVDGAANAQPSLASLTSWSVDDDRRRSAELRADRQSRWA